MIARLGDICKINMGQSPDSSSYNDKNDGLPFFQGNADFGELYPTVRVWCSQPSKVANKNDILISVRAPIGALNIADCECCIGRGIAALTVDENACFQKYLWHALHSKVDELNSKGTGSTFKAINKRILEETEIPLPPLDEQRKIAAVLDKISDLTAKRRRQLDKLDELVKSRFVEMFGDPLFNTKGWAQVAIKDACASILGGGTPSKSNPEYFTGTIPWVSPKDMKTSIIGDSIDHITEDAIANSTTNLVPQNSVLMVVRSGILKHALPVAINKVPVAINQDMKAFIPNDRITAEYFMYYLKSIEQDILGNVRCVTADNIDFKAFQTRQISLPPLKLQQQFTSFLTCSNTFRFLVYNSLKKLELLKYAVVQKYFETRWSCGTEGF